MSEPLEPRPSEPAVGDGHREEAKSDGERNETPEETETSPWAKRRDYREKVANLRSKFKWAGNANLWLVLGTWALAAVGILSLRDSAESISRSQRAWAGPTGAAIDGAVTTGQPVTTKVTVANTGREPALNFAWALNPIIASPNDIKDGWLAQEVQTYVAKCKNTPSISGSQVLFPTTGIGTGFQFTQPFDKSLITEDVVKGRDILVVEGCFIYDAAGGTRHSSFCYLYKGGTTKPDSLNLCQVGNFAD